MNVTITINDASPEDREKLREAFAPFLKKGWIKVKRYADSERTDWEVYSVPLTSENPVLALRIRDIRVLYSSSSIVDTKLTVVKEEKPCISRREEEAESPPKIETPEPKPASLVNEPKHNKHHQQPSQRESKEKGGAQLSLFNPEKNMKENVEIFINFWNERMWMPKIRGTPRQCREIGQALRRPYFQENYAEAVAQVGRSKFLRGGLGKNFKFNIDWFLQEDNFDKIIEGKYQDNEQPKTIESNKYEREEI